MKSGSNGLKTGSREETASQREIAVRTTFWLFREHLLRLLHSLPHADPCCLGPVAQTAKALVAKARVVRTVKKCMMAGGGGAWGLKEIVCLGVLDKSVCTYVWFCLRAWNDGQEGKEGGRWGRFYRWLLVHHITRSHRNCAGKCHAASLCWQSQGLPFEVKRLHDRPLHCTWIVTVARLAIWSQKIA